MLKRIRICSRSSVGRVYRCNFDGRSPIPNWTTIFNFFSCVIGKATIIVNIPEVLCWILKLFLGDSADVGYTVDDSHHIRIVFSFMTIKHCSWRLVKRKER